MVSRRRRVSCGHQPKGICLECRRAMYRGYARHYRERDLERRNATATTCQRKHGPGACGVILEHRTDALGRVATSCPKCERRRAGICRDCPRAVEGRIGSAVRCAEHKARAREEQVRAYASRNRDELRKRAKRANRRRSRASRRRHNEKKRQWRLLHPDKVRQQKRREALRQSARTREYMRAYREQRKRDRADRELRRYHVERAGGVLTHACTGGCGSELTGRAKKCTTCKQRDVAAVIAGERAA